MFVFGYAGEQLTLKIRKKTFEAMLRQEIGWYDKKENSVGALCAQLASDASSVQGVSIPELFFSATHSFVGVLVKYEGICCNCELPKYIVIFVEKLADFSIFRQPEYR